jgi:regulator of protease activity HflC (stomatin/prohibitin superfamily)
MSTSAQETFNYNRHMTILVAKVIGGVLLGLILLIWGWKYASSKFQVYQAEQDKKSTIIHAEAELKAAEFQKRIAVEEALAKRDSAPDLAEAEITRAKGVAEANKIIADSITDEYVRWLYVDQLDEISGQIIYIPTEGGIPILEANRMQQPEG